MPLVHTNFSQIAATVKRARQLRLSTFNSSNINYIQLVWQKINQKNWRVKFLMWLLLVFN